MFDLDNRKPVRWERKGNKDKNLTLIPRERTNKQPSR